MFTAMCLALLSAHPGRAQGPYSVPHLASATFTIPANRFLPAQNLSCLVRSATQGSSVSSVATCYPTPAPPPYSPQSSLVLSGVLSQQGVLTLSVLDCTDILGIEGMAMSLAIPLSKQGSAVSGQFLSLTEDASSPYDCQNGTTTTGSASFVPLSDSTDTDGDNCPDYKELGTDPGHGGVRDPFNPYDFPDVYTLYGAGWIDVFDVQSIAFRVQGFPNSVAYDAAYDLGAAPIGPNSWNLGPPDGWIGVDTDFQMIAQQFGVNCTLP